MCCGDIVRAAALKGHSLLIKFINIVMLPVARRHTPVFYK